MISTTNSAGRIVLRISGRFEFSNRTEFSEKINLALKDQPSQIILDMSDTTFIDSAALALLFKTAELCQEHKAMLAIVNPQSFVRDVIELTNLSSIVPTFDSLESVHLTPVVR